MGCDCSKEEEEHKRKNSMIFGSFVKEKMGFSEEQIFSFKEINKYQSSNNAYNYFFGQKQKRWIAHFKNQCQILEESCIWAERLPTLIERFRKMNPEEHYRAEVHQITLHFLNVNSKFLLISTEKNYFAELIAETCHNIPSTTLQKILLAKTRKSKKTFHDEIEDDILNRISFNGGLINFNETIPNFFLQKETNSSDLISLNNNTIDMFLNTFSKPSTTNQLEIHNQRCQRSLFIFSVITTLIEIHLNDKKHILSHIKRLFHNLAIKEFTQLNYEYKEKNYTKSQLKQEVSECYDSVIHFLRVYQETIVLFYKIYKIASLIDRDYCLFTKNNLYNWVTCIVFTEDLYLILFDLQKCLDSEEEIDFGCFKTCTVERFGVPIEYRLNDETKNLINEKYLKNDNMCINHNDLSEIYTEEAFYIEDEELMY